MNYVDVESLINNARSESRTQGYNEGYRAAMKEALSRFVHGVAIVVILGLIVVGIILARTA